MKKFALNLLLVLVSAVLLTAGNASALNGLREDPENFWANPDQQYEKVISRIEKASHSNSYHGFVLIAADDGIILYGGPKTMTTEGNPADLYTTYNIGSCSKRLRLWPFFS